MLTAGLMLAVVNKPLQLWLLPSPKKFLLSSPLLEFAWIERTEAQTLLFRSSTMACDSNATHANTTLLLRRPKIVIGLVSQVIAIVQFYTFSLFAT